MIPYKIRINLGQATQHQIANYAETFTCYAYSAIELPLTNPHIHLYIETQINDRTLRSQIRKFAGTGNGIYSLKLLDELKPIEYLAYMLKMGGMTSKNIDEDTINLCNQHDEKIKKEIQIKKEKRKPIDFSDLEKSCSEIINELKNYEHTTHYEIIKELTDQIITYLLDKEKLIRINTVEYYLTTIICRNCPSLRKSLISSIGTKLFMTRG